MKKAASAIAVFLLLLLFALASSAQAAQLEVRGRVVDESGAGVGMVTVLLEISDMRIRRQIDYDRIRTTIDGGFRFDLSKHENLPSIGLQFNTLSPRHRETVKILVAEQKEFPLEVVLEVAPGSVAKGIVVGGDGAPMEGVDVSAFGARSVKTDAQGGFELFGLPANGGAVVTARKEGYVEARERISTQGVELVEGLQLVLEPANTLEGVALDPRGKPLTLATVFLQLEGRHLRREVDEQGAFRFEAVPDNLTTTTIVLLHRQFPRLERVITEEESTAKRMTLQPEWPLKIAGQIKTGSGEPMGGSEIIVQDGEQSHTQRAPTDAEGRFTVGPLHHGKRFTITAMPPAVVGRFASGELEFTEEKEPGRWAADVDPWPQGYTSLFDVELEGNEVRMTRRDSGRGGLPGVIRYEGTVDEKFSEIKGTIKVEATGAKGEFTARSYNPSGKLKGAWDLREQLSEGEQRFAAAQINLPGAPFPGTQLTELTLAQPQELAGRVLLENGRPLLRGTVILDNWNGSDVLREKAEIMAGGKFSFKGLPEGIFRLVVLDEDDELVLLPQIVRSGLTDLELQAGDEDEDPMDEL